MTNKQLEGKARRIMMVLEPALQKVKGKYPTGWGNKTHKGLIATVINIMAENLG
jgi:hypothetical protein